MSSAIVTIKHLASNKLVDLSLPRTVQVGVLVPVICEKLGWATTAECLDPSAYSLRVQETNEFVTAEECLVDDKVMTGDTLILDLKETGNCDDFDLPWVDTQESALVTKDATLFLLRGERNLVGRIDPGSGIFSNMLAMDLDKLDTTRKSGRKHALILHIEKEYYIQDLKSKNGTLLNGEDIGDERRKLNDGDVLQFGRGGIKVRFRAGRVR